MHHWCNWGRVALVLERRSVSRHTGPSAGAQESEGFSLDFASLPRRVPVGGLAGGADSWCPGTAGKPCLAATLALVKFDHKHMGRAC